ncbi:FliH/SctL family protein, partial [Salinibacter ruber]|uniref:FliH/SctL family protein n=1 Tax=Salinibacter ruber TaxID=146919 RepID=UPI0020734E40
MPAYTRNGTCHQKRRHIGGDVRLARRGRARGGSRPDSRRAGGGDGGRRRGPAAGGRGAPGTRPAGGGGRAVARAGNGAPGRDRDAGRIGERPGGADDDPDEQEPTRTDAEWRAHLEEKVEAARAEGYEEGHDDGYEAGYDDGYAEAEATLRAEFDDTRRQLSEDIARFEELWETYIDDAESEIIELTLDLAETIVDAPFTETMRQASEEAVIEAVTELAATPPVTIRLHPVDCQRVRESGLVTR